MILISHGNLTERCRSRFSAIIAPAMLTIASLGVSSSQVVLSTGQKFAGTWKAEHEGKTILVLELRPEQGTLAGTIRMMDFEMDLRGTGAVQQLRGGHSQSQCL
jgi:hypothetical protein